MKIREFTTEELKFITDRLNDCRQWNEDQIFLAVDRNEDDITVYEGLGHENMLIKELIHKIRKVREDIEKDVRHLFPDPKPIRGLHINDVLDFFVGIEYNKICTYLREHSPVAERIIKKLNEANENAGMISIEVVAYWIYAMDKRHRDLIQKYILKNHTE